MTTPRPSSLRHTAAAFAGAALLGSGGAAIAGPPPSINVQIAAPGFYTSFATGPAWAPYYAYPPVPVVPVFAPPVYVPVPYGFGPPPGYWRPRHVEYRQPAWGREWRDDDRGHWGDRPRHHEDGGRRGGPDRRGR